MDSLNHCNLSCAILSSFSVNNSARHADVTRHVSLTSNHEWGKWCRWLEMHLSHYWGVTHDTILQEYFLCYSAYLIAIIGFGAISMWSLDYGLSLLDAFYLATSAVTMTGLSSVTLELAAGQPILSHGCCCLWVVLCCYLWCLSCSGER